MPTNIRLPKAAPQVHETRPRRRFRLCGRADVFEPTPPSTEPIVVRRVVSADEWRQRVSDGRGSATVAVGTGCLDDGLADAWLGAGLLTPLTYQHHSVDHWLPTQPLPLGHVRLAQQATSPGQLLLDMAYPRDPALRQIYALRMLAAFVFNHRAVAATPAEGTSNIATSVTAATSCCVCGDTFADDTQPCKLAACEHPATMGKDCFLQSLAHGYAECPYPDCKTPISPEEALRLGASDTLVKDLANRWVQDFVKHQTEWRPCPTPECCGGVEVAKGEVKKLGCGPCGATRIVYGQPSENMKSIFRDIACTYLGDPPPGGHEVLPCYHCGHPSEKKDGCSAVTCDALDCRRSYHFVATYVPLEGAAVAFGLFDGLRPGSSPGVPALRIAVLRNAERLGLIDRKVPT